MLKICSEWMLNMMQYGKCYSKIRHSWKETESKWEVCFGKRSFQENNKFKVSRGRRSRRQSKREILIGNIVARGKKEMKGWTDEKKDTAWK